MAKRTYIKRDAAYWAQKSNKHETKASAEIKESTPYVKPALARDNLISEARSSSGGGRTTRRRNQSSKTLLSDRYSNISGGLMPWQSSDDGITVKEAIELCQKAYANIALFRNVIDMMAEFSNNEIYFEDGTKESRKFFSAWLKRINIWNLTDQYFREYFRGGNVFMWRVDGKFDKEDFLEMVRKRGAKENEIPLKYVILNPKEIAARHVSSYDENSYEKVLSQYDIKRLADSKDPADVKMFKALPPETQNKIKRNQYQGDGIYVKLDPNKLYFSFYKKQDYEAFAIPFGFPVLADLNMKQEFKNMDAAIMRTVQDVILLITNGAKPDDGGTNPQTIADLQSLFANETTGRILVADYTTKAEFIIPDLKRVLGKEKYEVLNQDIKDGLQNIMLADDAHATADIKVKIFLDRLREARQQFLNDFLQKEINRVSGKLNFRKAPVAKFKEIDMKDDLQLMRVATRLMELSILTPEQGIDFLKRGELPTADTLDEAQQEYIKKRKKGYYNPMVGGVPTVSPPVDKNAQPKNSSPQNQKGRPMGAQEEPSSKTTVQKMAASWQKINEFYNKAERLMKKQVGAKSYGTEQKEALYEACQRIMASKNSEDWYNTFKNCLKDPKQLGILSVKEEILSLKNQHELPSISSATILYYSLDNEI